MNRLPALILFILTILSPVCGQAAADRVKEILNLYSEQQYLLAATKLQELNAADTRVFELNNLDYLLGRAAERSGNWALASANYHRVIARKSVLREYALNHLAEIARRSGNLMLERVYLQEILDTSPASLLYPAARTRLARNNFENANYPETIRMLSAELTGGPDDRVYKGPAGDPQLDRLGSLLVAQAYLQSGRLPEARALFQQLSDTSVRADQPDDISLEAVRKLDLLDTDAENLGNKAPRLPDHEHMRRGFIYQFNREFSNAALHFKAVVENHPESRSLPDAIYQTGRSYFQQGEFTEAITWFERTLEQFPEHPVAKDALTQVAGAYSRVGKYREAILRYKRFMEKYPDDPRLDRAYLNIIDILRDHGAESEALQWTARTQEAFKGKVPEALAVFAEARIFLSRSDWTNALMRLEKMRAYSDLGGTSVAGGTTNAEITYLRAYVFEQLRQYQDAIDVYLTIPDGRNEYYGGLATGRLQALSADPNARPFLTKKLAAVNTVMQSPDADVRRRAAQSTLRLSDAPDERERALAVLRRSYEALPKYNSLPAFKLLEFGRKDLRTSRSAGAGGYHGKLAEELLFLGLYDEGTPELAASFNEGTSPEISETAERDRSYTMAVFYLNGDMAYRTAAIIEPYWRNIPDDYQIELVPREQLRLLYPTPFRDALLRHAPANSVDPRFVLSIMRQESRFRPEAKSYAAARGAMQFISSTADQIAAQLGRGNFRQDNLYDPGVSILFGSRYLGNLEKQFPEQFPAVAASYNAGEENMKRWLTRSKTNEPDRYVPEIAFAQTKDYVFRVMANYRVYRFLYDEQLKMK